MSMLSAQCDKLRELATRCDELQVGAVRAVRVPLDMGSILREAADTIWELRCKMADMVDMRERARVAESENAELREELAKARDPQRIGGQADPSSFVYAIEQLREFRWQHATNDEDAIPYINNVVAAHERENAKLRELVNILVFCTNEESVAGCDGCAINGADMCAKVPEWLFCDSLIERLRELGVEVDG